MVVWIAIVQPTGGLLSQLWRMSDSTEWPWLTYTENKQGVHLFSPDISNCGNISVGKVFVTYNTRQFFAGIITRIKHYHNVVCYHRIKQRHYYYSMGSSMTEHFKNKLFCSLCTRWGATLSTLEPWQIHGESLKDLLTFMPGFIGSRKWYFVTGFNAS